MVSAVRSAADFMDFLVKKICVFFMVAMFLIILVQVAIRYLDLSLLWADEVVRYMTIMLGFLGSTVAFKTGSHTALTVLMDKVPPKAFPWVFRVGYCIVLFFLAIMIFYGIRLCLINPTYSPVLRIKLSYPLLSIPFSGFLMFCYALMQLTGIIIIKRFDSDETDNKEKIS